MWAWQVGIVDEVAGRTPGCPPSTLEEQQHAAPAAHSSHALPPWMQILIRDPEDAFSFQPEGKTGGINVIDLANINSCSFLATQDLGRKKNNGIEILGRFDNSDVRGCNLLLL